MVNVSLHESRDLAALLSESRGLAVLATTDEASIWKCESVTGEHSQITTSVYSLGVGLTDRQFTNNTI